MTKTQSLYTTYGSIVFVIYNVKPEIINNSIAHLPMTDQQESECCIWIFVEFLISPYYRRIKNKTPIQRESLATFENLWLVRGGEQNAGSF